MVPSRPHEDFSILERVRPDPYFAHNDDHASWRLEGDGGCWATLSSLAHQKHASEASPTSATLSVKILTPNLLATNSNSPCSFLAWGLPPLLHLARVFVKENK